MWRVRVRSECVESEGVAVHIVPLITEPTRYWNVPADVSLKQGSSPYMDCSTSRSS